jgi:hypothetical protein
MAATPETENQRLYSFNAARLRIETHPRLHNHGSALTYSLAWHLLLYFSACYQLSECSKRSVR